MSDINWEIRASTTEPPEIGKDLKISFSGITVRSNPKDSFSTISNPQVLKGVLLLVCFYDGVKMHTEGSAIMVGPATAITASHVIQPRIQKMLEGNDKPFCLALTEEGSQIWDIKHIKIPGYSDIAIISLIPRFELPNSRSMFYVNITTRTPKIGENIEIYGFRSIEEIDRDSNYWNGHYVLASGSVSAIYPQKRDNIMMPWPCFEVECPSLGGSSGGPAFDINGNLIGILSTSFDSENNKGPSFVSILWRALVAPFQTAWPKELMHESGHIIDRNGRGFTIIRPDALTILDNDQSGNFRIHIQEWS